MSLAYRLFADGIWTDKNFQARMQWYADIMGSPKKSGDMGQSVTQNGGMPVGGTPMGTPTQEFNQNAQAAAAVGQQNLNRGGM